MSHQIGSRTPRRDTYVGFCLYEEEEEEEEEEGEEEEKKREVLFLALFCYARRTLLNHFNLVSYLE